MSRTGSRAAKAGDNGASQASATGIRSDADPRAFSVNEVMSRLDVTRPTLYRLIHTGELRTFRVGTRRLISAEALASFIQQRERLEAG